MSFTDFFQANIVLFIAFFVTLVAAAFVTLRELKTKGTAITSQKLSLAVNHGAFLADLRSEDDYRTSHIPGARNIPFENLKEHLKMFGKKEDPIVLYCYSGKKSALATNTLKTNGFTNVSQLEGGFETWKKDNMPVAKK